VRKFGRQRPIDIRFNGVVMYNIEALTAKDVIEGPEQLEVIMWMNITVDGHWNMTNIIFAQQARDVRPWRTDDGNTVASV
jgi:hypothetical protein